MRNHPRTQTYLVQLVTDGLPGLRGRVQLIGDQHSIAFASARRLVELLRDLSAVHPAAEGEEGGAQEEG